MEILRFVEININNQDTRDNHQTNFKIQYPSFKRQIEDDKLQMSKDKKWGIAKLIEIYRDS